RLVPLCLPQLGARHGAYRGAAPLWNRPPCRRGGRPEPRGRELGRIPGHGSPDQVLQDPFCPLHATPGPNPGPIHTATSGAEPNAPGAGSVLHDPDWRPGEAARARILFPTLVPGGRYPALGRRAVPAAVARPAP